jgi:hypothetical protein
MADYDEAIRINPAPALAYNNRGDAWFNKGDLIAHADFAPPSNTILACDAYGNRGYAFIATPLVDTPMLAEADVSAYINRGNGRCDSEQRRCSRLRRSDSPAPTDARGCNRGMIRLYQDDIKGGRPIDKALQYDPADAYSKQPVQLVRLAQGAIADFRSAGSVPPAPDARACSARRRNRQACRKTLRTGLATGGVPTF